MYLNIEFMYKKIREKSIMKDLKPNLSIHMSIICGNILLMYFLLHSLHGDIMNVDNTIHKLQIMLNKESKSEDIYPTPISNSRSSQVQRSKRQLDFEEQIDSMLKNNSNYELQINKTTKQRKHRVYCKAVHLIGASPHSKFEENDFIGPWFNYEAVNSKRCRAIVQLLGTRKNSIRIRVSGLYLIYAQVSYILLPEMSMNSTAKQNGYAVELKSQTNNTFITHCVPTESSFNGEFGCYTAIVYNLHARDRLFIKQQNINRLILMNPETTYLGLVLLQKERGKHLKKKHLKL